MLLTKVTFVKTYVAFVKKMLLLSTKVNSFFGKSNLCPQNQLLSDTSYFCWTKSTQVTFVVKSTSYLLQTAWPNAFCNISVLCRSINFKRLEVWQITEIHTDRVCSHIKFVCGRAALDSNSL